MNKVSYSSTVSVGQCNGLVLQHGKHPLTIPNCWQLISNTNVYSRKCTFPNPAPEGRTDTLQLSHIPQMLAYSPNVGSVNPMQMYILENAQSSTPREGHTDTFQLTHIPQLYKCIFWKMHIPQPRPLDRGVCPKIILRLQKNILVTFCSGNIKYSIQLKR